MNESLEAMIERHEGCRFLPYPDSTEHWTIGIGHALHKPLTRAAVDQIFKDDLNDAINECLHAFPWFADLALPRQYVLIDMCFNLGLPGLLKFKKFLAALAKEDYETAANEMIDSLWAKQVKGRALELADMMREVRELSA